MGQKWMQSELERYLGIMNEGYTNLDIRTKVPAIPWEPPHIKADYRRLPIRSESMELVLFDPPQDIKRKVEHIPNTSGTFWIRYSFFTSEHHMEEALRLAFEEVQRILLPRGRCIFKWADTTRTLDWALRTIGGLKVERILERNSKGGKYAKTWFVWLVRDGIPGRPGES